MLERVDDDFLQDALLQQTDSTINISLLMISTYSNRGTIRAR
jgi:hypothetical protein